MPDTINADEIKEKGTVRGQIKAVDKKVDYLLAIMLGVVVVLFVGFLTLLFMVMQLEIEANHDKQTDYQRLTDQVQAQNSALNSLRQQLTQTGK
jgi:Tfp pilus assembly protein PilO